MGAEVKARHWGQGLEPWTRNLVPEESSPGYTLGLAGSSSGYTLGLQEYGCTPGSEGSFLG